LSTLAAIRSAASSVRPVAGCGRGAPCSAAEERSRDKHYPLSRWWLRPLAGILAAGLVRTWVRPWHVSLCGGALAAAAGAVIVVWPEAGPLAGLLVLGGWLCDRTDGQLARRQGTASPRGAWLDANLDELADVGIHLAIAWAAIPHLGQAAWLLAAAFLAGKYLFVYGLTAEAWANGMPPRRDQADRAALPSAAGGLRGATRRLYHLPANADVRVHFLALALAAGCPTAALAASALYFNLRWIVRYGLVCRRLPGVPQ
jgi:phosphatidylglycerophosphate synthase